MNNDIDNPNSEYWKQKYLKYKSKYMNLNNTTGGRHSHRSNSPRHSYRNPYYRPQYPTLPQMPFIVTNSDSNLTIGNDKSDVSIVMPLSPFGQFGPVARGNTMFGPYGQFMTVVTPKSKAATTTTTTPSTSFTDDPIYKAHGSVITKNSTIYFRIIDSRNNYLVDKDDKIILRTLDDSSPYSNQIKTYMDEFFTSPIPLNKLQNKLNFMVFNEYFIFKYNIASGTSFKSPNKFVDASVIDANEKKKISI